MQMEKNKQRSDDHHKIAIGLLKKCDRERALSHLIKAVQYDSKNFILRHSLATTYYSMEDYQKSLAEYQKSLKLEPKLTESRASMVGVLLKTHQLDRAEKELIQVKKDKTYTDTLKLLVYQAWLDYEKGRYAQAKRIFEEALSLNKGKTCFNYIKLGQTEKALGNLKTAQKHLKLALIKCREMDEIPCYKPDYEEYFEMAKIYLKQKNHKKAIYYLKIFIKKAKTGAKVKKAKKLLNQLNSSSFKEPSPTAKIHLLPVSSRFRLV